MLGFGPFCSDLGPKGDEALKMGLGGGTDVRTDGEIPPVFYRTSSPSGPLPKREREREKKKEREREREREKKGRSKLRKHE